MQDSEHLRKAGDDARSRGTAFGSGTPTDAETAAAFASSWNHVGEGSVYKREDFVDWLRPIDPASIEGETVLEMGFGNGSQLFHMAAQRPKRLCGVELGDTLEQTRRNLEGLMHFVELHRGDLTTVDLGTFDLVYCIGVLHHLRDPERGFEAVVRHTRPGGRFHCWVYAREGNGVVIRVVEPVRRLACRLPWWLTKYGVALPMVAPYYAYAKALRMVSHAAGSRAEELAAKLPLGAYTMWISRREFPFFHHVAFDQLVTPQTHFLPRATLEKWLQRPEIDPSSTYIIQRNGNSWNFGGRRRSSAR